MIPAPGSRHGQRRGNTEGRDYVLPATVNYKKGGVVFGFGKTPAEVIKSSDGIGQTGSVVGI